MMRSAVATIQQETTIQQATTNNNNNNTNNNNTNNNNTNNNNTNSSSSSSSSSMTIPQQRASSSSSSLVIESLPQTIALMEEHDDCYDVRIPRVEALPILTAAPVLEEGAAETTQQQEDEPTTDPQQNQDAMAEKSATELVVAVPAAENVQNNLRQEESMHHSFPPTHRPEHISVTICKPSQEYDLGIDLRLYIDYDSSASDNSHHRMVYVHAISETSPFHDTPLSVGDRIVEINGVDECAVNADTAWATLTTAPDVVTIVVRNIYHRGNPQTAWVHVVKPDISTRLGLALMSGAIAPNAADDTDEEDEQEDIGGDIRIHHFQNGLLASPFPSPLLQLGERILFINNVNCCDPDVTVHMAAALIQTAERHLTFATTRPPDPSSRPGFISATVPIRQKRRGSSSTSFNVEDALGLGLGLVNNELRVTSIDPRGYFKDSPIKVGDKVLSINQIDCLQCPEPGLVIELMDVIRKEATIVVQVEDGNPSVVAAMVTKPRPDAMVGIVLRQRRRDGYRRTFVSKIFETGLLIKSIINVGDRLLSINGHDCRTSVTVHEAVDFIKRARDTVTIVTQTQHDVGAVVAATGQLQDVMRILQSVL